MNDLEKYWYRFSLLHFLLIPVSLLFRMLAALRRALYRSGILASVKLSVPVIVVGNISVGGTGKTPFTLWLAQRLLDEGWHPGIISRGYGGNNTISRPVASEDVANEVGDEPLLMAQRGLCPVWIGRDRPAAAQSLLQAHPECDVILSDDGLQHYRLQRDVEIVLVDGMRRFGNGRLLPAGPLREPVSRLASVDFVVVNGGTAMPGEIGMNLLSSQFYNLLNPDVTAAAHSFIGQRLHAVAGIGHPARFFIQLERLGLSVVQHAFPDHHRYSVSDLDFADADAILMTEKDAVKCTGFATEKYWALRVDAQIDTILLQRILEKIDH